MGSLAFPLWGGGGGGGGGVHPDSPPPLLLGEWLGTRLEWEYSTPHRKSHTNATNAQTRLKLVDSHGDICPSNLQGVESIYHHRINCIGAHIISYQAENVKPFTRLP